MASKHYQTIDVHTSKPVPGGLWPAQVPPLTQEVAAKAFKRLYRFGMGKTYAGRIVFTTGNRRAVRFDWAGNERCAHINPSQGWRDFVHSLSHWLDYLANGTTQHGKHHAQFERKLVREVVKRGYLDGKLEAPAREAKPAPTVADKHAQALARLDAREKAWNTKAKRAATGLATIAKERKRIARAIARDQQRSEAT